MIDSKAIGRRRNGVAAPGETDASGQQNGNENCAHCFLLRWSFPKKRPAEPAHGPAALALFAVRFSSAGSTPARW
jgi:hypothetical protein